MTDIADSEVTALKMAKTEYSQKVPGILLAICFIFFIFMLMSGENSRWFGVKRDILALALCGISLILWSQFEFSRYILNESMQWELGDFEPITSCNKPLAYTLPAQYEYDPEKKERVLWCPRIKVIHITGTLLGNKGIHFAIWFDIPGIERETANGKKVYGDFKVKTFSGLRSFLKPIFVDKFGNNVSPSRKYKPGKSLFFVAERVRDIVKYESMDFPLVMDILDERAGELEKIIRTWQDLSPKQKEEISEKVVGKELVEA